jgi:nicotinamidase-related amidase
MWDRHWCEGANRRLGPIVEKAVPVLAAARRAGFLIIHSPSDTMDFYRGTPQRAAAQSLSKAAPPAPLDLADPPLPVESPTGGCDTPEKFFKAWTRQHPGIPVAAEDLVTDRGEEVYAALQARRIERLFILGVHTNMCILNRSFAIRQMTKWGVRCVLLRDLTDAMYSPADAPQVSHERGTELVVEHIEKYWCPTALSADLRAALGK